MWYIFFEKQGEKIVKTIAVHNDCLHLFSGDKTTWLVTDNPFDYNPNSLHDRKGKVFEIKLIAQPK